MTEPRPLADAGAPGAFAERLQLQLQAPPPREAPRPAAHAEPVPASQDPAAPEAPDAATRQARRGLVPQRARAPAPPAQRGAEAPPTDPAGTKQQDPTVDAVEGDTGEPAEATAPGARRGRGTESGDDAATPLNWMLQWVGARPQPEGSAGALLHKGADMAPGRTGKGLGHGGTARLMRDDTPAQAVGTAPVAGGDAWQATLNVEGWAGAHQVAQEHRFAAASGTAGAAAWAPVSEATGQPEAPAPVQVRLDTPVNRPEFRDELAAQVSRFTHDGIQEAVLNLNPAEMGPITVQIVLSGTQATVDFQALQPATRELIESSLPSLARALHAEGLTLSGGSVGDQRAPSQGDQGTRGGHQRDGSVEPVTGVPNQASMRRTDGRLDLYA